MCDPVVHSGVRNKKKSRKMYIECIFEIGYRIMLSKGKTSWVGCNKWTFNTNPIILHPMTIQWDMAAEEDGFTFFGYQASL